MDNNILNQDILNGYSHRDYHDKIHSIIENIKELTELHKILISGILGDTVTASFFKFTEQNKIPSAKEILSDFEGELEWKFLWQVWLDN